MKKWLRRIFWLVPIVLVVLGVALSMRPKPVVVEITTVATSPMRVTVSGEGKTRVQDKYVVLAPVHGNLARVELHAGDVVEEGNVLATIEPIAPPLLDPLQRRELEERAAASAAAARQAAASVGRAETNARFSARDLERVRSLVQQGSLSSADLDTAQLAAEQAAKEAESARFGARVARHEREMAKAALERSAVVGDDGGKGVERPDPRGPLAVFGHRPPRKPAKDKDKGGAAESLRSEVLEIHAPVAGKVLRILRNSEGVVQPGEALLEVADLSALEIVLDVLTTDAVRIAAGDDVDLLRWGGESPLHGRVRMVEPAAYTRISALGVEEQRVNVIIDILEPVEARPKLGDGFALDVEVVVWQREQALVLPLSALFRDEQGWSCYVIEAGLAMPRRLEIGQRNDFEVEVLTGVVEGEEVILHPGDRVREGTLVEVG
jgi:HlyD family secretion protein